MDSFSLLKNNTLSKKDKSNKGEIDIAIRPLIDAINKKENYFTTSSCSGRIIILVEPKSRLKKNYRFLFESHKKVRINGIMTTLKNMPPNPLWFRFEPVILHIACKTATDAKKMLILVQQYFKHSGLISLHNKIIIELRGSEFIEAPVAISSKLVVTERYLKLLIKEANRKLEANHKKIKELKEKIEITLSA